MIDMEKVDAAFDPEVRKLWLRVLPRLLEVLGEPGDRQEGARGSMGSLTDGGQIPAIQGTSV